MHPAAGMKLQNALVATFAALTVVVLSACASEADEPETSQPAGDEGAVSSSDWTTG